MSETLKSEREGEGERVAGVCSLRSFPFFLTCGYLFFFSFFIFLIQLVNMWIFYFLKFKKYTAGNFSW